MDTPSSYNHSIGQSAHNYTNKGVQKNVEERKDNKIGGYDDIDLFKVVGTEDILINNIILTLVRDFAAQHNKLAAMNFKKLDKEELEIKPLPDSTKFYPYVGKQFLSSLGKFLLNL